MKKIALLLIPIILCTSLMACDPEAIDNSSSIASKPESSIDKGFYSSTASESTNESSEASIDESSEALIEKTFEISVTLEGTEALAKAELTLKSGFSKTVTVTVEGAKEAINSLQVSEFSARIDLSSIASAGDVECLILYTIPENATVKSVSDEYATVSISKKVTVSDPPSDPSAYKSNGIVISGKRGMEEFGGTAASGEKTAQYLNKFKEAVGADVNVYILAAPIASAFYAPEKYPNSIKNHVNCFNGLRDALVDVKYVDVLGALSNHVDEDIYFRTDHHWQALGAYYAAEQLALVAGTPFDTIDKYTAQSSGGVVGSLYGYSKASVLKNNPDTITWFVPNREHTVTYYSETKYTNPKTGLSLFSSSNSYSKFIHGDSYSTHIQSDINNGRKLLIFKDSFGNALAPFVLSSFEEVIIVDYREFKLNALEFIEEHEITDVCFAMAAFSVATSKREYILKLLKY